MILYIVQHYFPIEVQKRTSLLFLIGLGCEEEGVL